MKLSISAAPSRAAALVAVAARLFLALTVDAPTTHNGAWISAIIAGLLAAPWVLCVQCLRQKKGFAAGLLRAFLSAWVMLDAAVVFGAAARSAGYLALDRAPSLELLLSVGIAVLWCVWRNGDAVGYGGMLWMRVGIALLAVIALLQGRYLRREWLHPLLGNGWQTIIEGGIRGAGGIVAASAVLLLPKDGEARPIRSLGALLGATTAAVVLILLRLMMTPTQLTGGWLTRLDSLLCNGRAPLYLQLPLIVAWFAGLLHLLACEGFAAAGLMQSCIPSLNGKICGALAVAAPLMLSRLEGLSGWYGEISQWSFVAIAALTALALIMPMRSKGGKAACASD